MTSAAPRCCDAEAVIRPPVRLLAIAVTAVTVVTGCSAGPSTRPPLAVLDAGMPPPVVSSDARAGAPVPPPVPPLQAPTAELSWSDCTLATLGRLALAPGATGLMLECAGIATPADAAIPTRITLGLLRARLPQTPAGAAPLVLLSGADEPATTVLARLAAGGGGGLLDRGPIIAMDRRGSGRSTPISCLTRAQRAALVDLDPANPAGTALADALRLGELATLRCRDVLGRADLTFDAAHAADDVQTLRSALGVQTLAVLGSGGGAQVAVAAAVRAPQRFSRLILDSPTSTGADLITTAQAQARGSEVAFSAFAAACVATGCPVTDPRQAVLDLAQRARSTGGLAASGGRRVSAGAVLFAVRHALRGDAGQAPAGLGGALAQAQGGDATGLGNLVDDATAGPVSSASSRGLDAEFVAGCSDAAQRPTPAQVADLAPGWAQDNPLFGADAAVRLLLCLSWPTMPAPRAVTGLAALPAVLVIGSVSDPVHGANAARETAAALRQAGAGAGLLRWQGVGYPVLGSSPCAMAAVLRYVTDTGLPEVGTRCPA